MKGIENHQLLFEEAWERTISPQDRQAIIQKFEASHLQAGEIKFIPFRWALNHQGELLATVLIQNGEHKDFPLDNLTLSMEDSHGQLAEKSFSLPHIVVKANTSMPWTFIFPPSNQSRKDVDNVTWGMKLRN